MTVTPPEVREVEERDLNITPWRYQSGGEKNRVRGQIVKMRQDKEAKRRSRHGDGRSTYCLLAFISLCSRSPNLLYLESRSTPGLGI